MTSKPDSVSTLGYHWADFTGTTLADAITHWCPSGNPVLICIIGTHWNTTGKAMEDHWKDTHWLPTVLSPVAPQCTLGSKFQPHWIATGLPLSHHRLRVRAINDQQLGKTELYFVANGEFIRNIYRLNELFLKDHGHRE